MYKRQDQERLSGLTVVSLIFLNMTDISFTDKKIHVLMKQAAAVCGYYFHKPPLFVVFVENKKIK